VQPLLVIELGFHPDLLTIGGFLLAWHGIFTAVGILIGVNLSMRMAQVIRYNEDDAYTLALVSVPSGVIGARLLYVAEHWDFYGENPGFLFALWRRYPITGALDIAAFGIIAGQATGRIGDVINGEHLAIATDLPWGVIYTNPASPAFRHSIAVGAHHPATAYELIGDLVILGVLFYVLNGVFRRRPGLTFFTYLVAYAVMRLVLTELRIDSAVAMFGLRVPQLVSVIVVLVSVPFIAYLAGQEPVDRDEPPSPVACRDG
jgi:phosphatidylglycerol:prolipoprotein diacylglycerol transferase